ncbi:MAG: hypothetical protein ACOH1X_10640 [Kaistella sp.]
MSYTIVGMFPTNEAADKASNKLDSAGFTKDDYKVSRNTTTGDFQKKSNQDFVEDEKTGDFWNWLFGDDEDEKERYSYAGSKSNLVTVYADNLDRAEKARDIMNDQGAINVSDFTKDKYTTENELSAKERARIIAKAKNNLYFTHEDRIETVQNKGMDSDMDSQGNNSL